MADPDPYFNSRKWTEEISDRVFYDPINRSYATWGLSDCPGTTDAGPWDGRVGFGYQVERGDLDGITERGTLDSWADGCSDGCPEGYICAEVYAFAGSYVGLGDLFTDESKRDEDIEYAETHYGLEIRDCCVPEGFAGDDEDRGESVDPDDVEQQQQDIVGCTDPGALNYNSYATRDCSGFPLGADPDYSCCVYPGEGIPGGPGVPDEPETPESASTANCADPEVDALIIETYQTCFPNPKAPVPNWINQPEGEAFLNQKTCEYSIVIFADPPDCSEEYINSFIGPAINNLLSYYNKEEITTFTNPQNFREVEESSLLALTRGINPVFYREGLQFVGSARAKDFYIPPRPLAKTRILVTVGAEEFNRIPEKEENLFESVLIGAQAEPSYVVFSTTDMTRAFDVVARSFRFFEVPYVEWGVENGKTIKGLNFVKDADRIEKFYNRLKSLIEESYSSIFDLESIKINFNSNYKITSIQATAPYSVPVEVEIGLSSFLEKPTINNATIMAYISRLPDMRDDLMSRVPMSWYDLLEKYRYPAIEESYTSDLTSPIGEEFEGLLALSEAACPAGSSAFEPKKTAGQWLGAEANSIAQALLNKLTENPCAIMDARILENQNRESLVMEVVDLTLKEYLSSDRVINDLPIMIANAAFEKGSNWSDIGKLYQSMLDNLGYCGWIDLIKAALDCALNALGYDDSISLIVGAAVRGMDNEAFAKFLGKLSPEKAEIIVASVSEVAPQLLPFLKSFITIEIVDGEGAIIKPVHDQELAYSYSSAGAYREVARKPGISSFIGSPPSYPPPSAEDYRTLNQIVYDLIINDLLRAEEILEVLETLPGASMAIDILQKMDKFCVAPPRFYPPLSDFIRLPGINVDLCAIGEGGLVTPIPGAFEIPKLTLPGLGHSLIKSAMALLRQITKLALILILRRIIEIIYEEMCKDRSPGDPLGLRDALRSKCGSSVTDEQLNLVISDISDNQGCYSDPAALGRFIDNVSSVITECEFVDLINGVASENIYDLIIQIMKVDPLTLPLVECLGDRESLTSFFRSIGAFVDLEALCVVQPQDVPFSQDICDDLGLLALFRDTRAEALREKGVDEECINDQLCRLRDRTMSDLEDLMGLLHGGIEGILPDLINDPDSEKSSLLPTVLPSTEIFTNSIFSSMFQGIETQFVEDVIGRRGFLNMCLADSRGRGYVQHIGFQRMFGPSTFNIYGSRGTRTYPPRDEWGQGAESPEDHNDWVTEVNPDGIEYTQDAAKFIWLPFFFNPLSSTGEQTDDVDDEARDEGPSMAEGGSFKGRPPAVGGLPDKVAGYLQEELSSYTIDFRLDDDYTFEQTWEDYDDPEEISFKFKYDYHKNPPAGRTSYDYGGYRVKVSMTLDGTTETMVKYTTEDPLLPEVSDYIRFFLTPEHSVEHRACDRNGCSADHWAAFMLRKIDRVLDPDTISEVDRSGLETAFTGRFRDTIFSDVSEGFIEMITSDISRTDIFDYGFDRHSIPEVVYFHEEPGMSLPEAIERYGGTEGNPPFYIKEPAEAGFTKVARSIIPEIQACDEGQPETVDFPNYEELVKTANDLLNRVKDDRRLSKCNGNLLNVIEAPFDRALPAAAKALNESLIYATIRTYLVEFMLKSLPVYNFMRPGYPNNYTNLLTEYIVEYMERGLKNTGRGANYVEKWETYWWIFLEQVVQSFKLKYQTMVKNPSATLGERKRLLTVLGGQDASQAEIDALNSITETVERNWEYYKNTKDPTKARDKKKEDWEKIFKIDSVRRDCKVILRRYVGEELERMSTVLSDVLPKDDLYPIHNVDDLILLSKTRPTPVELHLPGLAPRTPYVAGAVNVDEAGPVDVASAAVAAGATHPLDEIGEIPFEERNWPFVLERYIKIDTDGLGPVVHRLGKITNIFDWQEYVEESGMPIPEDGSWKFGMRLSFVPLEKDLDSAGFLGRRGIEENIIAGADYDEKAYTENYKYLIPMVSVELPIASPDPGGTYTAALYGDYVQPLLCKLVEETEYKLLFTHIFPLARYISFLAVYVANTFVPSLAKVSDGWAATKAKKRGGGQWIGAGKFGGMRTWRGKEGMEDSLHKTKTMVRQLLEASCNTNYLYKDREEISPKESFVRANKSGGDFDPGLKWWQWSSLRPAPCKKKDE